MEIRVLGCSGNAYGGLNTTCIQIGEGLVIDAGGLSSGLDIDELARLDDIIISHSHFDHIKDLPMLPELVSRKRKKPITVHASQKTARELKKHLFNGVVWPDFTSIPSARSPLLKIKTFKPGDEIALGGLKIRTIPVSHAVESLGFIVSSGTDSFAMSGDTGRTTLFWKELNRRRNIRMLLVETSFPDEESKLAHVAGHLTPAMLQGELKKLKNPDYPIMVYHLKPAFQGQVVLQLKELKQPNMSLLEQGAVFSF